jgi:hypothetical protein
MLRVERQQVARPHFEQRDPIQVRDDVRLATAVLGELAAE